jgi:predicted DNA-binding protein (MmcQ/YjbR family)
MNTPWVRRLCLSLPHTTESIQWGEHLVFKIGGKIYAIAALEPADAWLSFKTAPDEFARLTEIPGIIPAPYLARAQWVALETFDALPAAELERLIRDAYGMIFAKLPRKKQAEMAEMTKTRIKARSKAALTH